MVETMALGPVQLGPMAAVALWRDRPPDRKVIVVTIRDTIGKVEGTAQLQFWV